MNNSACFGIPVLVSKILMYEFCYDYVKPKYGVKTKLLCGYRQFHCIHKTDDIYKDKAKDVETRFHTSNYEFDRSLPKGKKMKR